MTFDVDTAYDKLSPLLGDRVCRYEMLARHCTFGVGGPADIWVVIDSEKALLELVTLCSEQRWPLLIAGNGTNVLYADEGVRGVVARIAINAYTIEEQSDGTALLIAGAGVSWPRLINELCQLGWGGLEFGSGIPGTLGGGVISNAGVHGHNIGEVLQWVDVIDARQCEKVHVVPTIVRYMHDELDLAYRHSRFRAQRRVQFDEQGNPMADLRKLIEPAEIIARLGIRLYRDDPQQLRVTVDAHKSNRKQTQPSQQSAGSVFKNPAGNYSGRLIEAVGLKGMCYGGAQISERHANFIVNTGGAKAADVAALIKEAHNRVAQQFGVDLEMEIELRGEWKVPVYDGEEKTPGTS
jgi:UDP-N-acetylmuramate dehydrogenase